MATRPTQPLIYDRKQTDVLNKNTKGNYNVTDINRIMEWELYLQEYYEENGYHAEITELPQVEIGDMYMITKKINTLKTNLINLKNTYYVLRTTPPIPSTSRVHINYIEANNIEKIISDIDFLISSMIKNYIYLGTTISGDDWTLQYLEI